MKRGPAAQVRPEVNDPVAFDAMLKNGMVGRLRLTNAEVEKLFAGTDGAGVDDEALAQPEAVFTDMITGAMWKYPNEITIALEPSAPEPAAASAARDAQPGILPGVRRTGRPG